ncbi:sulfite exporter TauE/SafE family protein [Streptomyces xinghaiensis]|uniref:sulfite exporter TauE/SafE family protein n=1 Tax=Kocuria TaxID=57493 RepID=UPI000F898298|nr:MULTISPECIES: sulfite exporter TauE/SafE family protein [unclassified Kocuria]RUP84469.1 sulfite exporter TauE/SafE family protein [Kocuria sp. HSID17590]RUQ03605.1 sulfite exporter TauE/SafE family protein [Kocuria sp. HSID17582]
MLPELTTIAWAGLVCGALLVGFSKTALPGINTLAVALFAAVLPAKASTGALLVLLLVGDCFALWNYRRHAHWPTLVRMMPAVVVGLAVGGVFLAFAGDSLVRRVIGILLILLMGITLWQRRARRRAEEAAAGDAAGGDVGAPGFGAASGSGGASGATTGSGAGGGDVAASSEEPHGATRLAAAGYGTLGGFTTMVANAGGPVMSMYFLAARFPKHAFLGTAAWFFVTMNLLKVPVSVGLGLITTHTLVMDAVLVPGVVVGALVGKWALARIAQHVFDTAVIAVTLLGALYLLV